MKLKIFAFLLTLNCCCSIAVRSNSLQPHDLKHTRLHCPSLSSGVCPNSCPLSRWCHPTISSSIYPFSSCSQSFSASGSFSMSQYFASGGQPVRPSASASVLPKNIQGWFPLELTGLISLLSKGLSRVFSSIMIRKHQFFSAQSSLWSISHIHTWLLILVVTIQFFRIKHAVVEFCCCYCFVDVLVNIRLMKFWSIPSFLRAFIMNWYCILSKNSFLCIWDICSFFYFVNIVNYTVYFSNIESTLHSWKKPSFSWCLIISIYFWIQFIQDFSVYVHDTGFGAFLEHLYPILACQHCSSLKVSLKVFPLLYSGRNCIKSALFLP